MKGWGIKSKKVIFPDKHSSIRISDSWWFVGKRSSSWRELWISARFFPFFFHSFIFHHLENQKLLIPQTSLYIWGPCMFTEINNFLPVLETFLATLGFFFVIVNGSFAKIFLWLQTLNTEKCIYFCSLNRIWPLTSRLWMNRTAKLWCPSKAYLVVVKPVKIRLQRIYGSHGFSSSSKITQYDGRRARRYQKFPSECYFFLTNKHYRRSHLVIISVSNLRAALCPHSFWRRQFPKSGHVISSFLLYNFH